MFLVFPSSFMIADKIAGISEGVISLKNPDKTSSVIKISSQEEMQPATLPFNSTMSSLLKTKFSKPSRIYSSQMDRKTQQGRKASMRNFRTREKTVQFKCHS